MVSKENPITSENFADLLIAYGGDKSIFNQFPQAPVSIVNNNIAIIHIPVQEITSDAILKFGYGPMPSLLGIVGSTSLEASKITKLRSMPHFDLRGKGVLLGIIDTGIDYTNPVFRYADGSTRIAAIWDQTIESENVPEGRGYGTDYTREQINQALQTKDPLSIVPSMDDVGHGIMVAGIAGGSEIPESNFAGVAPDTEFVVVKLKQAKKYLRDFFFIPEQAVCFQETDIFFATDFVLNTADSMQKPIILCVTVNSSQSAHDARGAASSYLSQLSSRSGTGVVVAAGNEGNARRHYYGTVEQVKGYTTVELNVGENEKGFSMELWGQSPSIFSIDFTSPSGEYVSKITAMRNEFREITFVFEPTIIYLDYRIVESESGDQLIILRFKNPSPGIWKFNIYERGDLNVGFHIWLPMEGFISEHTFFIRPDPYTTILAGGNAQIPITVVAYNDADDSYYMNSSRGYTRLGTIKPNITAPGVNVQGPTMNGGFTEYSGTCIAASHTAGVAAMMMEWGVVRENLIGMSTVEINKLLMRGARRTAGVIYPNRDWGFGILDIYNVFDSLRGDVV